jgi:hypothetical protein
VDSIPIYRIEKDFKWLRGDVAPDPNDLFHRAAAITSPLEAAAAADPYATDRPADETRTVAQQGAGPNLRALLRGARCEGAAHRRHHTLSASQERWSRDGHSSLTYVLAFRRVQFMEHHKAT